MTLRVPVSRLAAGERELDAPASHYLVRVHRARVGDRFTAFDVDAGTEADAEVLASDPRRARVRLGSPRAAGIVSPLPVTLLWAIGKSDKPEAVLRDATALGARRVVLVNSERSVVRLGERAEARRERWLAVARQAARQSGRGDVPELLGPLPLSEALPHGAGCFALALDPDAGESLTEALAQRARQTPIAVLIGPEGGWAESELLAARAAGYRPVRFGRLVLRTETAVPAVLGALLALCGGEK